MSTNNDPVRLLSAATAAGSGNVTRIEEHKSFQAFITGTSGALAATVDIQVSNDGIHFVQAASIPLTVASWSTIADDDTDGFYSSEIVSWIYIRARLISISGTGAAVSVFMGQ